LERVILLYDLEIPSVMNLLEELDECDEILPPASINECIERLYRHSTPRPLTGKSSLLHKTLGEEFYGPDDCSQTYIDHKYGELLTDFTKAKMAIGSYDQHPRRENAVRLLMDVGNVLFKRYVADCLHNLNPDYLEVRRRMDVALDYLYSALTDRGLSVQDAEMMMRTKYSIRMMTRECGIEHKIPLLEFKICMKDYDKTKITSSNHVCAASPQAQGTLQIESLRSVS
jgi:hypothetical protein